MRESFKGIALVAAGIILALAFVAVAQTPGVSYGSVINWRKSADFYTLGTSSAPCLADGTTASKNAAGVATPIPAGTYVLFVKGEPIAPCDGRDADCAAAPTDADVGSQYEITITSAMAGNWHCRSAGGLGWATLRRMGP